MDLYSLYMQDSTGFPEFKEFVINKVKAIVKEICIFKNDEHELFVSSYAFNVQVRDRSSMMDHISKEYNMNLDYDIWFDVFDSEDWSYDGMMMEFMKTLILKNDEPFIVMFNGCISVLERRDKVIRGERAMLPYLDMQYIDQRLEDH